MSLLVSLPWPPSSLSPNGSHGHWRVKAKARATFKATCGWELKAQGVRPLPFPRLHVSVVFCPPDRQHRDLDNMLARSKPLLDAVASAVGVDDSRWGLSIRWGEIIKGGKVNLIIRAGDA
jgi:crossover junction endodeoxyribonuclease RusA